MAQPPTQPVGDVMDQPNIRLKAKVTACKHLILKEGQYTGAVYSCPLSKPIEVRCPDDTIELVEGSFLCRECYDTYGFDFMEIMAHLGAVIYRSELRIALPTISFIYVSNRPGSIDLLAYGLARQTDQDYELIVVDGYPGRIERGRVVPYLLKQGVRLTWYGPPRPQTYPQNKLAFARAMNTGAIHARGRYLIFLHDYCVVPAKATQHWKQAFFEEGATAIISGIACRVLSKPPEQLDDITLWNHWQPLTTELPIREVWIPETIEIFYVGLHVTAYDVINGIDERADNDITWALGSFQTQAYRNHLRPVVKRALNVAMLDHRDWKGEVQGFHWNYNVKREEDVLTEPPWCVESTNPYRIDEERARYLRGEIP